MVVTDDSESYIKTDNDSMIRTDDEDAELYDNHPKVCEPVQESHQTTY